MFAMAIVKLFEFRMYDISTDEMQRSRRRVLEGAIQKLPGAVLLPTSAIDVEENDVRWDPDMLGFTVPGWFPRSPFGMR